MLKGRVSLADAKPILRGWAASMITPLLPQSVLNNPTIFSFGNSWTSCFVTELHPTHMALTQMGPTQKWTTECIFQLYMTTMKHPYMCMMHLILAEQTKTHPLVLDPTQILKPLPNKISFPLLFTTAYR